MTGGESGFVTFWATENPGKEDGVLPSCSSGLKIKNKKSKKNTPY